MSLGLPSFSMIFRHLFTGSIQVPFAGLLPNGSAHTFFVVSRIENPVKRFFENNVRRSKDIKKMINRKM